MWEYGPPRLMPLALQCDGPGLRFQAQLDRRVRGTKIPALAVLSTAVTRLRLAGGNPVESRSGRARKGRWPDRRRPGPEPLTSPPDARIAPSTISAAVSPQTSVPVRRPVPCAGRKSLRSRSLNRLAVRPGRAPSGIAEIAFRHVRQRCPHGQAGALVKAGITRLAGGIGRLSKGDGQAGFDATGCEVIGSAPCVLNEVLHHLLGLSCHRNRSRAGPQPRGGRQRLAPLEVAAP